MLTSQPRGERGDDRLAFPRCVSSLGLPSEQQVCLAAQRIWMLRSEDSFPARGDQLLHLRVHGRPFPFADKVSDAWSLGYRGRHEWLEESMQARRLQIPVGGQHSPAVRGQDPGHIREGHSSARPALEGVERDDLTRFRIRHLASRSNGGRPA